ncbi:hypothetical protein E4U58_003630 [Claviceps cyperi]|nr:hypothetical protein E4U58_003630 [Claviceps cyperi]
MKAASRTKNLFVPVALFTVKLCEDAGKEVELLDELLSSKKSDAELEVYRQLAKEKSGGWSLTEQGLLLKDDRLFVPERTTFTHEYWNTSIWTKHFATRAETRCGVWYRTDTSGHDTWEM